MKNSQMFAILAAIYFAPHFNEKQGVTLFGVFAVLSLIFLFLERKND
jgi:hypothetical protein